MKIVSTRVVAGVVGMALIGGLTAAAQADEVTVTGSRFMETPVGINYTGVPIKDVSLSETVSVADLNLSTAAGMAELDKRILTAARSACGEIKGVYPVSKPEGSACARAAVERSMSRVRKMLAATRPTSAG
jgi:UrcA family protein